MGNRFTRRSRARGGGAEGVCRAAPRTTSMLVSCQGEVGDRSYSARAAASMVDGSIAGDPAPTSETSEKFCGFQLGLCDLVDFRFRDFRDFAISPTYRLIGSLSSWLVPCYFIAWHLPDHIFTCGTANDSRGA